VQALAFAADGGFGARRGLGQCHGAGRERHVLQPRGKRSPVDVIHRAVVELRQGLPRQRAKGGGVHVVQRHADDPVVRQKARRAQVKQPRQQLALGQIAGGAEEHHHLR